MIENQILILKNRMKTMYTVCRASRFALSYLDVTKITNWTVFADEAFWKKYKKIKIKYNETRLLRSRLMLSFC